MQCSYIIIHSYYAGNHHFKVRCTRTISQHLYAEMVVTCVINISYTLADKDAEKFHSMLGYIYTYIYIAHLIVALNSHNLRSVRIVYMQ